MMTKKLLHEHIFIHELKSKLSHEMQRCISNPIYVQNVLGIKPQLIENASAYQQKEILIEALNLQNLAQSIKSYVGDTVNKAINTVTDVKDVLKIVYKIIADESGKLIEKGLTYLNTTIQQILNKFKNTVVQISSKFKVDSEGFKKTMDNIIAKVSNLISKLKNYSGILGFLANLALCTLLKWVETKILDAILDGAQKIVPEISDVMIKIFDTFGDFFKTIASSITIENIIDFFKDMGLSTVFKTIKVKLAFVFNITEILSIMAELLRPIIREINLTKMA